MILKVKTGAAKSSPTLTQISQLRLSIFTQIWNSKAKFYLLVFVVALADEEYEWDSLLLIRT